MDVLLFTNTTGIVAVFYPVPGAVLDEALINRVMPTGATNPEVVDSSVVNALDRDLRDAWRQSGRTITIDLAAAKVIHADRLADEYTLDLASAEQGELLERFKGNTQAANEHSSRITELESTNINAIVAKINAAQTLKALKEITI